VVVTAVPPDVGPVAASDRTKRPALSILRLASRLSPFEFL